MKVYAIYDRLSQRHSWQTLSTGVGSEWFNWVISSQVNYFKQWSNNSKYPDYQIGYLLIDSEDKFENLKSNYPMLEIFNVNSDNLEYFLKKV